MALFYEFFAGGGMVRAGLGRRWRCVFANDIDAKKAATYSDNWGIRELVVKDVGGLTTSNLPGIVDLAWASFPCQDLSLAGAGAGLTGKRSGTFWPFWKLIKHLREERRAPRLIVLENVCGALTSHNGKDFAAIGDALSSEDYAFGAVVIDAVDFLPHSRPRLFIIGIQNDVEIPAGLKSEKPNPKWHPENLLTAQGKLSRKSAAKWVWWALPNPPRRRRVFADLIEDNPEGVNWHSPAETRRLLDMMSDLHLKKVREAISKGNRMVGAIYKRTRRDENGHKIQRAEVRFDDVAGCLRTPIGGSSRQSILLIEGDTVRSRLLSPREAARLMGLPERYKLPNKYNEAYHLAGDGVAVPVVRFLAARILEPALAAFDVAVRRVA